MRCRMTEASAVQTPEAERLRNECLVVFYSPYLYNFIIQVVLNKNAVVSLGYVVVTPGAVVFQ